jgi:hypothetical protein
MGQGGEIGAFQFKIKSEKLKMENENAAGHAFHESIYIRRVFWRTNF